VIFVSCIDLLHCGPRLNIKVPWYIFSFTIDDPNTTIVINTKMALYILHIECTFSVLSTSEHNIEHFILQFFH